MTSDRAISEHAKHIEPLEQDPSLSEDQIARKRDVNAVAHRLMKQDPSLSLEQALAKAKAQRCHFYPPKYGCPIDNLPNEILAYIFSIGVDDEDEDEDEDDELWEYEEDEEGFDLKAEPKEPANGADEAESVFTTPEGTDDDDDDDDDEHIHLQFAILVSHVCRRWRQVALDTPSLWTLICFSIENSVEKAAAFIERSKELPLDLLIDCSAPDGWEPGTTELELETTSPVDEHGAMQVQEHIEMEKSPFPFLSTEAMPSILDLIVPHLRRWRSFEVQAALYECIYTILQRLSQCDSAPILETLRFYHYEDCEEYETFKPAELGAAFVLFSGSAPNLKNMAFWGVHIDWHASLPMLSGLQDVELAYHAKNVCPSFDTFSSMLNACPNLVTLSLCLSGPGGSPADWGEELAPIEMPNLQHLILYNHEPEYIEALVPLLSVPNLLDLQLDYHDGDFTNFAKLLATPRGESKSSILAGLEHLKISTLCCNKESKRIVLEQLRNLKAFTINCSGDEEEFFDKLMELTMSKNDPVPRVVYCPNLESIVTTAVDGKKLRKFIEIRRRGGAPIKSISVSEEDSIEEDDEKWIRDHVDEFEFFEPSSEEEYEDEDEEGDDLFAVVMQ